jgi:NADH-quinone oxidoreductase subunit N
MSDYPALQDLMPLLPELVLACGAMLMLMVGVMIGERSSAFVNGWCVIVLLVVGAALAWVPPGPHAMFGRQFPRRRLCALSRLTLVARRGAAAFARLSHD